MAGAEAIRRKKREIRVRLRGVSAGVSADGRAAAGAVIAERVLALPGLQRPTDVLAYAAIGTEVPTAGLVLALQATGHSVAVPVIGGERAMRGRRLGPNGLRGLTRGPLGVPVPDAGDPRDPDRWMDDPAVVLLPGVAFDPDTGARLGRGGGFYDAWIATHPRATVVALAMEVQLVRGLPVEPHDRPVHLLVTETGVRAFSA